MNNLLTENAIIYEKQRITLDNGITQVQLVSLGSFKTRTKISTQTEVVLNGKQIQTSKRRFYFDSTTALQNDYVIEWQNQKWEVIGTDDVAGYDGSIQLKQCDTILIIEFDQSSNPPINFTFLGNWNALTNTPLLINDNTLYNNGDAYLVVVGGEQWDTPFYVGDWVVFDGDKWIKVINQNIGSVYSVNGQTGVVNLSSDDILEGNVNFYDKEVTFINGINVSVSGSYPDFEIIDNSANIEDINDIVLPLTNTLTSHIDDTLIHYPQSSISITESQISDLQNYALSSDFELHTLDTTIHFTQSDIELQVSQVSGLQSTLNNKVNISEGVRLKWIDLVTTWTSEPSSVAYSGVDGEVLEYTYDATKYYRFIPNPYNSEQDIFYETFNDPNLTTEVAVRGQGI